MENENNNQEPDPYAKPNTLNGISVRTNCDFKGNICGYSSILVGEERLYKRKSI